MPLLSAPNFELLCFVVFRTFACTKHYHLRLCARACASVCAGVKKKVSSLPAGSTTKRDIYLSLFYDAIKVSFAKHLLHVTLFYSSFLSSFIHFPLLGLAHL
jgi:hypothetical protein